MIRRNVRHATAALFLAFATPGLGASAVAQERTGTINGRVHVVGAVPANPPLRMGVDPVCAALNRGASPVQQFVVKDGRGGLANALVRLDGTFPKTSVPATPVTIAQEKCMFTPRLVAARAGQTLIVVNRDMTLHTAGSQSTKGNTFNATQPSVGMVFSYVLKTADVFRLKCDPHSWMIGWVAVVDHPYFAVSSADGSFTINRVPAGRRTIRVWHEVFGEITRTVTVGPGETITVDVPLSQGGQPRGAAARDIIVPLAGIHRHAGA